MSSTSFKISLSIPHSYLRPVGCLVSISILGATYRSGWMLAFTLLVSISSGFSPVTAQSIRTSAHFFSFLEESTRFASESTIAFTRSHHSFPRSGSLAMCHYYCPHALHAFATLAIGISFFYIYHLDSFHLHEGWSCTKKMKLRRNLAHQSQLSRPQPPLPRLVDTLRRPLL